MNVLQALRSLSAYPVPPVTIERVAAERGLVVTAEADAAMLHSQPYLLCKADILIWLSEAPNVSQGGQNFSFTDEQRKQLREQASEILEDSGEEGITAQYGYKGDTL